MLLHVPKTKAMVTTGLVGLTHQAIAYPEVLQGQHIIVQAIQVDTQLLDVAAKVIVPLQEVVIVEEIQLTVVEVPVIVLRVQEVQVIVVVEVVVHQVVPEVLAAVADTADNKAKG